VVGENDAGQGIDYKAVKASQEWWDALQSGDITKEQCMPPWMPSGRKDASSADELPPPPFQELAFEAIKP
jgi:hypothetical protein